MHIWADFFSAWTSNVTNMDTPLSVNIENIKDIYTTKPQSEILIGSLLALIFIPGHLIGTYFLFLGVKEQFNLLSKIFLLFGWYGTIFGTGYHYSLIFIGEIVKTGNQELLNSITIYWEIWSFFLVFSYFIAFILLTFMILMRKTLYPKWIVILSPLITILVLSSITIIIPIELVEIKNFLVVTGINLPIFIFYIVAGANLIKKHSEISLNF